MEFPRLMPRHADDFKGDPGPGVSERGKLAPERQPPKGERGWSCEVCGKPADEKKNAGQRKDLWTAGANVEFGGSVPILRLTRNLNDVQTDRA